MRTCERCVKRATNSPPYILQLLLRTMQKTPTAAPTSGLYRLKYTHYQHGIFSLVLLLSLVMRIYLSYKWCIILRSTVEYGYLHHFGASKFDAKIRLMKISVRT